MILRELEIGDRFVSASDKMRKVRYKVVGKREFNLTHIAGTRKCLNETTKQTVSKSCALSVIKLPVK